MDGWVVKTKDMDGQTDKRGDFRRKKIKESPILTFQKTQTIFHLAWVVQWQGAGLVWLFLKFFSLKSQSSWTRGSYLTLLRRAPPITRHRYSSSASWDSSPSLFCSVSYSLSLTSTSMFLSSSTSSSCPLRNLDKWAGRAAKSSAAKLCPFYSGSDGLAWIRFFPLTTRL